MLSFVFFSYRFSLYSRDYGFEIKLREDYRNEHHGTSEVFSSRHSLTKEYRRTDYAEYRFKREKNRGYGGVAVLLTDYLQGVRDTARANGEVKYRRESIGNQGRVKRHFKHEGKDRIDEKGNEELHERHTHAVRGGREMVYRYYMRSEY